MKGYDCTRGTTWIPFKRWAENKHVIYCIAMTFLTDWNAKTLLIFPEQLSFFCFAKAVCIPESINYIFNEHGWQGSKQKNLQQHWYGKSQFT